MEGRMWEVEGGMRALRSEENYEDEAILVGIALWSTWACLWPVEMMAGTSPQTVTDLMTFNSTG